MNTDSCMTHRQSVWEALGLSFEQYKKMMEEMGYTTVPETTNMWTYPFGLDDDSDDPSCKHEWINVSFSENPENALFVCKHCDVEKP